MIRDEQEKNKQNINFSETIQDLKNGTYDHMMLGGKEQVAAEKTQVLAVKCGGGPCPVDKACGAGGPCPAEKACGAGGPCPAEKACGAGGPCPVEKACGAGGPCPAEKANSTEHPIQSESQKMVIDPKTAEMVPAASEKLEKPATTFDIAGKVRDSIGFIQ